MACTGGGVSRHDPGWLCRWYPQKYEQSAEGCNRWETLPAGGKCDDGLCYVFLGSDRIAAGTEVTLMGGEGMDAQQWAEVGETNAHEIMSNLKNRVERVYI